MRRNIFLLSLLILFQFGCNKPTATISEPLVNKWYFVDGTSTTNIISDIDQNVINSSVPGTGAITVSGNISSSLSYISYMEIDNISYPVLTTQAIYDSSYPYGLLMVSYSSFIKAFSYIYYHKINENSEILFLGQSDSSSFESGGLGDPITISNVTLYALDGWFIDSTSTITIDGSLAPAFLNITANNPIEFSYTNNPYQDITYFSLEIDENGIIEGVLELNIDGIVSTDTMVVSYNLENDTLTIYDKWFLGENMFSVIDSIEISFSQDGNLLTLEFQYDPCQVIDDTLCYSTYELLIGLEENSLVGIQVTDNLVFSQIQPLRKKPNLSNWKMNGIKLSKIRQNILESKIFVK